MRLIDADALKATLIPLWNCHDDSDFANKDVWRELENAPTIDAVPVVRCKDCKHRPYGKGEYDDLLFPDDICPCQCDDFWYSWMPDDDWFCKDGERKEE